MKKCRPAINSQEPRYTTAQAAERLRVSARTVKEKCAAGLIAASKPGRDWLIAESSLNDYLNRGQN